MKCACCGQEIDCVRTNVFDRDGSDYKIIYPIASCEEDAFVFDTNENWCGYGLSEEEVMDEIECPLCGKFPFRHKEVQIYEIVRVVCFSEEHND